MIYEFNDFDVSDEDYGVGGGLIFTLQTPGDALSRIGINGPLGSRGDGAGNGWCADYNAFRLADGDGDGNVGSAFDFLACSAPELLEHVAINLVCRMQP